MSQFPIDQLNLDFKPLFAKDWTMKDDADFQSATGITIGEWDVLKAANAEKALGGRYVAGLVWIQNRKKWPELTYDACLELNLMNTMELGIEGLRQAIEEQEDEDDDNPLETQTETLSSSSSEPARNSE